MHSGKCLERFRTQIVDTLICRAIIPTSVVFLLFSTLVNWKYPVVFLPLKNTLFEVCYLSLPQYGSLRVFFVEHFKPTIVSHAWKTSFFVTGTISDYQELFIFFIVPCLMFFWNLSIYFLCSKFSCIL